MEPNRRRYPRVRARGLAAHLRSEHGRTQCVVENISLGGMFVRTDQLEEVGTAVAVLLVKPGWKKQLALTGRITSRIDGGAGQAKLVPGMGLQFTDLDGESHERLRSLLRELGAPDAQAEITVPDDALEAELRALAPEPAAGRRAQAPGAQRPSPAPARRGGETKAGAPASDGDPSVEIARLKVQLQGLVMQLSDAQQIVVERDAEIARLREELEDARAALQRALRGQ